MASRATVTMTRPPARLATISSVWATAGRGNAAHASKNRNALLIATFQRPPELGGLKLGYSFAESPGGARLAVYTQEELWQSNRGWENCRIASEKRARHASVFRSNDSGSRRRIRSLVSR